MGEYEALRNVWLQILGGPSPLDLSPNQKENPLTVPFVSLYNPLFNTIDFTYKKNFRVVSFTLDVKRLKI